MLHACPTGARLALPQEGGSPVRVRRQGGHGRAPDSILIPEDGEERLLHSEDGAVSRRTCFLRSRCIF